MRNLIYTLTLFILGNVCAQSNIKVNEKAPRINITDWIKNAPADKNLDHKYIVLEFWATWCGPCIAAVPHMNKIQKEFHQKDLYYISITDESVDKVERTLKRIAFKSIVATDLTKETQINFGDGVKGLETYPLTILIDKYGIVKWIGEPKNLNSSIMSSFLSNTTTGFNDYKSEKTEINKETNRTFDFKELITNKEIKHYFDLQETSENKMLKQAVGTSVIYLKSYKLKDIYKDLFNVKNNQLKLPENLKNKHFDLMYKNTEAPKNLSVLESQILNSLHITKQIDFEPTKVNVVTVQDPSLLEETLEKRFSSKSEADNKIIFTAFTIKNVLNELSNLAYEPFYFTEDNETKYDFIINTTSKNDIINSLKSYGLKTEEKKGEVEHITLINKE